MTETYLENAATARIALGACNLCEAICGLQFRIEDDRIVSVKGDPADPLSRGHICPKATALADIQQDPDRLRRPVKRTAAGWQEIGWEEAFDLTVAGLLDVREKHGANSIGAYIGNPAVHNYGSLTHAQHFLGPLKTRSRFSASSVDQLPHQLVALWMYGHQSLVPIPDIDRTQYFLVLGANPMVSNGSLMTVPDFRARLRALQARGGRMVVIDPRHTETAQVADAHHFIRPATDVAFLLALLNTLFEEGLVQLGRLAEFTDGLDKVRAAIAPFTPERAAAATGIAAGAIRQIARDFAAADGAVCYGRTGVSTQAFGGLCQWAMQLLNIVTGNLDRPGGAMLTLPAVDAIGAPGTRTGNFGRWTSRVRGAPEFGGELPVSVLAEEILTPGEGQIRAMVTIAGNPVLSTPNGGQLDRAFEALDFAVAVDFYINETTRHADVILPPTCAVEHDHYDLWLHVYAVRNTARYNQPILPKPAGALHDWEIFTELGKRISARLGVAPRADIRPDQMLDASLKAGPYGEAVVSLDLLKANPSGIDLGPMQPCLPDRLFTPDRRIDCAPAPLLADLARAQAEVLRPTPDAGSAPLSLIGRRHLRSNNSWMHNYERLVKGKPRHQLFMHPRDMAARNLVDGQRVLVRSRVGEVKVEVQATDEMMPGVVSLPHGWGHDRDGVRLQTASRQPGVSANDLADDLELDALCGTAVLNGLSVTVTSAAYFASSLETCDLSTLAVARDN